MIRNHPDSLLGGCQPAAEHPFVLALGRADLAFQRFTDPLPVSEGLVERIRAVFLAAKVAERALTTALRASVRRHEWH
jgi:hypothetical protein